MNHLIKQNFDNMIEEAKRVQAIRVVELQKIKEAHSRTAYECKHIHIPFNTLGETDYYDVFNEALHPHKTTAYAVTEEAFHVYAFDCSDPYNKGMSTVKIPLALFNQNEQFIKNAIINELKAIINK